MGWIHVNELSDVRERKPPLSVQGLGICGHVVLSAASFRGYRTQNQNKQTKRNFYIFSLSDKCESHYCQCFHKMSRWPRQFELKADKVKQQTKLPRSKCLGNRGIYKTLGAKNQLWPVLWSSKCGKIKVLLLKSFSLGWILGSLPIFHMVELCIHTRASTSPRPVTVSAAGRSCFATMCWPHIKEVVIA